MFKAVNISGARKRGRKIGNIKEFMNNYRLPVSNPPFEMATRLLFGRFLVPWAFVTLLAAVILT